MNNYDDFVQSKRAHVPPSGFDIEPGDISNRLFPFQRDIVQWAVRRGKAAIFAERNQTTLFDMAAG